ncbi:Transcriptional regulatory protein BaeR [Sinobacterium norvegicum]|uniref:Transcriptional regulatory protein BaeR n=2 Tax=Sinobacterium norvegicum TaxID=1641715 RepID=A0ABM9AIM0_9GAMM|nr:Transcriptional regulatory protein BaeR [Sinobacterium norvegicum]
MNKILIVEDEPKLAMLLQDYLTADGYEATIVERGDTAVAAFEQYQPSLVLLDLMLPGLSGLEVCKHIRQQSTVPIIMVTAKVEEIDRLLGLELGADDYICKPFSPREVVARVKAVLRRTQPVTPPVSTSPLSLDEGSYVALFKNQRLDLTAVEFQLLKALADSPGRILSRNQLMSVIYSDNRVVSDRTIDSHIKKLRRKITEVAGSQELIHSVYGVGYKYEQLD